MNYITEVKEILRSLANGSSLLLLIFTYFEEIKINFGPRKELSSTFIILVSNILVSRLQSVSFTAEVHFKYFFLLSPIFEHISQSPPSLTFTSILFRFILEARTKQSTAIKIVINRIKIIFFARNHESSPKT